MQHRPSSLPALKQCPRFVASAEERDFTTAGTKRHESLASMLNSGQRELPADATDDFTGEERIALEWAVNYILVNAPTGEPFVIEKKRQWTGAGFRDREGTIDVSCGDQFFDLKWRERDCIPQMADYALCLMEELDTDVVTGHVLFGERQRVQKLVFTRIACEALTGDILDRAENPASPPKACDYCGWCANRLSCFALLGKAAEVARNYSDEPTIKEWHPSKIESPDELAFALRVWRTVLEKWGASVEYHALEAVKKKGMELPGFKLVTESGGQYVPDVTAAFALLGIPQEEFLKACDLRMNTSKKYPDRAGIVDIYKSLHGIAKTAQATRAVKEKLADALKDKAPKVYLKAVKAATEETTNQ